MTGCWIEHVLPQGIDPEDADAGQVWIDALGPEWKQVQERWLHTPGNLSLVGADYNRDMSNAAFSVKKPVLAASKVYLDDYFKADDLTAWNQDQIRQRGTTLAEKAATVWRRPAG